MREIFDLIFRWIHVIAGIMWIGNSMLWNWIDRNLETPADLDRSSIGKIWLLHSGAFYHMEKTLDPPGGLPKALHWFKWQSYITWLSGAALLAIVYYLTGGVLLVSASTSLDPRVAIAISVALILLAWPVYNMLRFNVVTGCLAIVALTFGLTRIFSGRAAFLHVGAMLATMMAGNVFMIIMPAQRAMIAKFEGRGQGVIPELAGRAKTRSIHNNYLTFPVIVLMLSSHFPLLYGNKFNWLLLGVLVVCGASIRHFMNIRFTYAHWKAGLAATIVAGLAVLLLVTRTRSEAAGTRRDVSFAEARSIIDRRCAACHSSHPADNVFTTAPLGVKFDTPNQIAAMAPRIYQRAVLDKTMPFANKTKITDEERAVLGAWFKAGAKTK